MEFASLLNNDTGFLYSSLRCLILFSTCVVFIRFTNYRFNLNTPLDFLMITVSGGLISRGIVGATPLVIAFESFFVLLTLHWILSKLTFHFKALGFLFKGHPEYLIENGKINDKNMHKLNISMNDLREQMRQKLHTQNMDIIDSAILERTGNISFLTKNK
jgi:uncharacterized membrane protein YcaP (DUF421 family)